MWKGNKKRSVVVDRSPVADTADAIRQDPKKARLHKMRVVPFELFKEALENPSEFLPSTSVPEPGTAAVARGGTVAAGLTPSETENRATSTDPVDIDQETVADLTAAAGGGAPGEERPMRFGIHGELFLRDCYDEMFGTLADNAKPDFFQSKSRLLVEIRGSAGIGKSTFLAMCMSEMKSQGLKNFAVFHAPKSHAVEKVYPMECSIWSEGKLAHEKISMEKAQEILVKKGGMKKLVYIFADGCAPALSLDDFEGIIIVAASPSISTKTLRDQIMHPNIITLVMPPWTLNELKQLGIILKISHDVIENNHSHMNGIVRYALSPGAAKLKVDDAVKSMDARAISRLVATDDTDKQTETNMVHALILWQTEEPSALEHGIFNLQGNITYSMVSAYASKSVAQKLAKSEMVRVRECLRDLSAVAGAEGYRGALFEAYAIKSFREGGRFQIVKNEDNEKLQNVKTLTVPRLHDESVIVMSNNELSTRTLPLSELLKTKKGLLRRKVGYEPRLVWPKTTNFLTFDAFYLDEQGEMYPLQMTVAESSSYLRHELNSSGAYQAKVYLEKVAREVEKSTASKSTSKRKSNASGARPKKKFKAIFVTPGADSKCWPKKQNFTGTVKVGKTTWSEVKAAEYMEGAFDQFVIRLK